MLACLCHAGGIQGTLTFKPHKASDPAPTHDSITAARRAATALLPDIAGRAADGSLTAADAALVAAAGLLEVLAARVAPQAPADRAAGPSAAARAIAVFRNVTRAAPAEVSTSIPHTHTFLHTFSVLNKRFPLHRTTGRYVACTWHMPVCVCVCVSLYNAGAHGVPAARASG